jgi:hypothetical protein
VANWPHGRPRSNRGVLTVTVTTTTTNAIASSISHTRVGMRGSHHRRRVVSLAATGSTTDMSTFISTGSRPEKANRPRPDGRRAATRRHEALVPDVPDTTRTAVPGLPTSPTQRYLDRLRELLKPRPEILLGGSSCDLNDWARLTLRTELLILDGMDPDHAQSWDVHLPDPDVPIRRDPFVCHWTDPGASVPSTRRDDDNAEVVRFEDWPPSWVGTWIGDDGRTVRIGRDDGGIVVTVGPGHGLAAYLSAELLGGGRKRIERLPAKCLVDDEGRRYLEIEAGAPGLGPTYRLYAAVTEGTGPRKAHHDDTVDRVVLIPSSGIGLHDDFDDDLGVPWAYPLDPLRWPYQP